MDIRRAAQACRQPAKLTGAFDRYLEIVPEAVVVQMLQGRSAFSREGRLSAWVVIWLMIFQRLHVKGTLAVAVRELLVGSVRRFVPRAVGPAKQLSASTSAYSQARSRLPLDVVEKVSDLIFESLQQEPKVLSGLEKPMYLLDGSSIQLQHTKELVRDYPPQRNQVALSHWPILRVLVAHDVVSGLAVRPCWGPMSGAGAVSEQGLAKEIMS